MLFCQSTSGRGSGNLREGFRPRKRWGQHFLVDKRIAERIIELHHPRKNEIHLEIGSGRGELTKPLARQAGLVVAVEIDPALIKTLEAKLSTFPNVKLINRDILELKLDSLLPEGSTEGKMRVIGNLPFYLATTILQYLISWRGVVSDMTLMFQREVAERLTAPPNTKDYGYLTLLVNYYCQVAKGFDVPSGAFFPSPEVGAAVMRLTFRSQPPAELQDEAFFFDLIKGVFLHRRKTILNNLFMSHLTSLSKEEIEKGLAEIGLQGNRRPGSLSMSEFAQLSNYLCHFSNKKGETIG